MEEAAVEEREKFCDTLGRDDDLPRSRPMRLSGAMRTKLVEDQWADEDTLR